MQIEIIKDDGSKIHDHCPDKCFICGATLEVLEGGLSPKQDIEYIGGFAVTIGHKDDLLYGCICLDCATEGSPALAKASNPRPIIYKKFVDGKITSKTIPDWTNYEPLLEENVD